MFEKRGRLNLKRCEIEKLFDEVYRQAQDEIVHRQTEFLEIKKFQFSLRHLCCTCFVCVPKSILTLVILWVSYPLNVGIEQIC